MSKALRLSEKLFHRGLWVVAVVFAGFLIGLGSLIVGDLPMVEKRAQLDDFMNPQLAQAARDEVRQAQRQLEAAQIAVDQARLKATAARADTAAARESFGNWLATRSATQQSAQDPELIARTQALDVLQAAQRKTQLAVEAQDQAALDARQAQAAAQSRLQTLEDAARSQLTAADRATELRVFGYRLLLTLPLLVATFFVFKRWRQTRWWPFVWGFALFAGFTFFVELVPYLPSYGGYVHYAVGIIATAVVGRQAIIALNRYMEKQRAIEQLPDAQRRERLSAEMSYDLALGRWAKGVCPGCERTLDLKNPALDFCPHCGICLHNPCTKCNTRKSAFAQFCHACGAVGGGRG